MPTLFGAGGCGSLERAKLFQRLSIRIHDRSVVAPYSVPAVKS